MKGSRCRESESTNELSNQSIDLGLWGCLTSNFFQWLWKTVQELESLNSISLHVKSVKEQECFGTFMVGSLAYWRSKIDHFS